jgi:hypothetical protein
MSVIVSASEAIQTTAVESLVAAKLTLLATTCVIPRVLVLMKIP